MIRRCLNCSADIPAIARFCPRCGAQAPLAPQPRKSGCGCGTLLFILLLIFVAWLLFAGAMRSTQRIQHGSTRVVPYRTPSLPDRVAGPRLEVSSDIHLLRRTELSASSLSLHGAKLGDARSQIPSRVIASSSTSEVRCIDGNRFMLANGRVQEIVLANPSLLSQLPAATGRLAIADYFGDPQYSTIDGIHETYAFPNRGLSVQWNARTRGIDRITLSK